MFHSWHLSLTIHLLTLALPRHQQNAVSHHSSLLEDVPATAVHWHALPGMSVAEAAASHHHLIQGVVVFVLGVSPVSAQQCVAKRQEVCKVHPEICHGDEL